MVPVLHRLESDGVGFWTDPALRERFGVTVAFSERTGGGSDDPFSSLNLSSRVGDDPHRVDENRSRLLGALGLERRRERLTTAVEVHGTDAYRVGGLDAGAGAYACAGRPAVSQADALLTTEQGVPLALCSADCVLVALVAPGPAVAVVHAGWRGALASLPGQVVGELCAVNGAAPRDVVAYLGAHIRACHYEVGDEVVSCFLGRFGETALGESGGLDLDAVVTASLRSAGVEPRSIARVGVCTAEATDRFFSYRAEGTTGRHSALVCIA